MAPLLLRRQAGKGGTTVNTQEAGFSRRSFLTAAGGVTLGLGIARVPPAAVAAAEPLPALPWTSYYAELDPLEVGKAAYVLYCTQGGCGHGSAQSIIDALAIRVGFPWNLLPRGLYAYGAGGVVGWGTVCGALNGAIAVMDILGLHNALGNVLVDYFCTAQLPTDALVGWFPPIETKIAGPLPTLASSVSNSPLCHNSVSIWAAAASVPVADPLKKDRCARLVADVVACAVDLINRKMYHGYLPPAWTVPAAYAECYNCHTKADMVPSQQGRMNCLGCHDTAAAHGYWRKRNGKG
jgi:hypothetical protein